MSETEGVIAAVEPDGVDPPMRQRRCKNLATIISYLETGVLLTDERLAQNLVLTESQYVLEDNVLYKVEPDRSLRIIAPENQREKLFNEAHSGVFGAHLSDVKVHSELRCHYCGAVCRVTLHGGLVDV